MNGRVQIWWCGFDPEKLSAETKAMWQTGLRGWVVDQFSLERPPQEWPRGCCTCPTILFLANQTEMMIPPNTGEEDRWTAAFSLGDQPQLAITQALAWPQERGGENVRKGGLATLRNRPAAVAS